MAELLIDGIWWLHGTRGSNVFIVEADDGRLALVDTGFAGNAGPILEDAARASRRPLSAILLTHRHGDHIGSAAELRAESGAVVVAGRGDCVETEDGLQIRPSAMPGPVARVMRSRIASTGPVAVDVAVECEKEVLPGILAVPVPGHTDGSVCYTVPRLDATFVGDLVISHGGRLTRSMRPANRDDRQYLRTLAEFARSAPKIGLPGHGRPVMDGFGDQLRGLAVLPRRKATPLTTVERAGRMVRFSHGLWRRRKAATR